MSAVFNYYRYGSELFSFLGIDSGETPSTNYANCISPLLFHYGWRGEKRLLIDLLPENYDQIGLVEYLNIMTSLEFEISEFQVDLQSFDGAKCPALFIVNGEEDKPIVLIEKKRNKWKVFNSSTSDIIDYPLDVSTKGTLYLFQKRESLYHEVNNPIVDEKDYKKWLNNLFFRHEKKWILVFIYSLFINLSTVTTPVFVMVIYDKVVGTKDVLTLQGIILGLFLSIAFEFCFRILRLKVLSWIAVRMDFQISNIVFEKLLYFPYLHLESSKTSTHVGRANLFSSIRDFILSPPGQMLLDLPAITLYLFVIWFLSGTLVMIPLILIAIYIVVISFVRQKQVYINDKGAGLNTERSDIVEEVIYDIGSLRKSGLCGVWRDRLDNISGKSSFHKFKTSLFISNIENFCYFLSMLSGLATLIVGINLVWADALTVGGLIGTMMLIWRIISPLQSLATTAGRFYEMNNTMKRIHRVVTYDTEILPDNESTSLVPKKGDISFKNVGLKFKGNKDAILSGFTMEINSGDFVTLSGQSGLGKSSVLKLINTIYSAQMGNIFIGGMNLKQINEISLRRKIGYIGEKYHIYDGTLRENLKVACPSASDKDLIQSLVETGAWKHLSQFSSGLDFDLTGKSSSIPMSLKYQICLSRELLKSPKILLLDQLDNSLFSSECVEDLMRLIEKYRGDVTIVLVTNRRDLILESDSFIALVGSGQAVAGAPDELIKALQKNGVVVV